MQRRNPLLDPSSPFIQPEVQPFDPRNKPRSQSTVDRIDHMLHPLYAYSSAATQGAADSGVIPAKWISSAAHAVLPQSLSQHVPTPERIQESWEGMDKLQKENPYPGAGVVRAAFNVSGTIGQLAMLKGAAGKAIGAEPLPGTAGFMARTIGGGIFQGGTSPDEGVGMWNTPASIAGGTVAAILGPVQFVANKALKYTKTPELVSKISKTADPKQIQASINKHVVPESNYINVGSAAPDIGAANPKVGEVVKSLIEQHPWMFGTASMGMGSTAGGGVGSAVGWMVGGEEGADRGAAIGSGIGAAAGALMASPAALAKVLGNQHIKTMLNAGTKWFAKTPNRQYFINSLSKLGVYPVVQGTNRVFVHKDDPTEPNAYQKMTPGESEVMNSPEVQTNPLLQPGSPFI